MSAFSNFSELIAKYVSSLPTLDDGAATSLHTDINGRLLVQADVSVELSAADGDSVIISDGTNDLAIDASGFITVNQGTSPWVIGDGGGSITVDGTVAVSAVSGTVAVTQSTSPWVVSASDLDIRDLTHVSDSIQVGDGTDLLAVNADGSINVVVASTVAGAETDFVADAAGDGLIAIADANETLVAQQAVAADELYKIYAWHWASDIQGTFKLEIRDDGVLVEIIRVALNSGSSPTGEMVFPKPIEITGATDREVRVYFTRAENKTGSAAAAVNGELFV